MLNIKVFQKQYFSGPFEKYRRKHNILFIECFENFRDDIEKSNREHGALLFNSDTAAFRAFEWCSNRELSPFRDENGAAVSRADYYLCDIIMTSTESGQVLEIDNVSLWLEED